MGESPTEPILALVCGYADWERRRLAMFVAHVDESGKGNPILVVACLTATPGRWIKFTEEWQGVLRERPSIPHFKYSNAVKRGYFETKMPKLIGVINQHIERADMLAIRVAAFDAIFRGRVSATHDLPSYQGYVSIMAQCLTELSRGASHLGKVDFVFDRMPDAEFLEVRHTWKTIKKCAPDKHIKKLVGSEPTQRAAIAVKPLQGADLVAGLMWRAIHGKGTAPIHIPELTVKHKAMLWDEDNLPRVYAGIAAAQRKYGIPYEGWERRAQRLGPELEAMRLLRERERLDEEPVS